MIASQTIYAVGSGEYDQYGINVVFTSRELAEDAVKKGIGDGIEELELVDRVPQRCHCYRVEGRLSANGTVSLRRRRDLLDGPGVAQEHYPSWDYAVPEQPVLRTEPWDSSNGPNVYVEVVGRDPDACRCLCVETLERLSNESRGEAT